MEELDYTRIYWLAFLVSGALFALLSYLDYVAAGRVTVVIGISAALGVVIVVVSAYAVRYPDRAGGPTEPDLRFGIAVVVLVLLAGVTLSRLLGG